MHESSAAPATVMALRVVSGAADHYYLTASVLHPYVVGGVQYMVHNSGRVIAAL